MKICVIAGMIDAKLKSKLAPLQTLDDVDKIYLVRRQSYTDEKVVCLSPPKFLLKWLPFAELWRFTSLIKIAAFKQPDCIMAFGIVPHGVYAWWIGKVFRIPVIQHVMGKNDLRLSFPRQWGRGITLAAVRAAQKIAVRGSNMKRWLEEQRIDADRIFVPHNVHDFDLFKPDLSIRPDHDLIYVGLLSPYKRLYILLEVLAEVQNLRPGTTMLMVGDGPDRPALQQQAKKLGIESLVTFAGNQDFKDLPGFYNRAKVFVMTSQGEGLPMAMIEAMSCGLPAVVPSDADIQEVAVDGHNSLIVQEHTSFAYSSAVVKLLTDDKLMRKLAAGALDIRDKRKQEFSLEFQKEVWRQAINGVLGKGPKRLLESRQ
jgi:glycosyltransferase involved in cell wall biosynthesis